MVCHRGSLPRACLEFRTLPATCGMIMLSPQFTERLSADGALGERVYVRSSAQCLAWLREYMYVRGLLQFLVGVRKYT